MQILYTKSFKDGSFLQVFLHIFSTFFVYGKIILKILINKKEIKMIDIRFLKDENRAVAYDDNKIIGECNFTEEKNIWNIVHTEVNEKYQGQGIARRLVDCIIDYAEKYSKELIADCSYAQKRVDTVRKSE